MRVIFMGTTDFSKVVLEELIKEEYEIVGVVTQPDRPFGRKKKLKAPIVKEVALENNILVMQPENIKKSIDDINALDADLIVTCAYGQIVPIEVLNHPKYKSVNVHASLLPKYRGGAPIHWSIINGENKTGLTLMQMDEEMDSGDIITQREVTIEDTDTMGDVERKLIEQSKLLINVDLKAYLNGEVSPRKQKEDEVTYAYTIRKKDEYIDFNRDVEMVYNHIRGLIPWPVSYSLYNGDRVKFHDVTMTREVLNVEPKTILSVHENGVDIACKNGYVTITKIQPAGKPVTAPKDFMNGIGRNWKGNKFS